MLISFLVAAARGTSQCVPYLALGMAATSATCAVRAAGAPLAEIADKWSTATAAVQEGTTRGPASKNLDANEDLLSANDHKATVEDDRAEHVTGRAVRSKGNDFLGVVL